MEGSNNSGEKDTASTTTTTTIAPPRVNHERGDEVAARVNLGTGNRKNPIKLCAGLEGQQLVFAEGAFDANCVLYIR